MLKNHCYAKYRTWWSNKRIEEHMKHDDILDLWQGKKPSRSYLSDSFNGKIMPNDEFIRQVSVIFGVSLEEAKSHFFCDYDSSKSKKANRVSSVGKDSDKIKQDDSTYKESDVNSLVEEAVNYICDDEIDEKKNDFYGRELIMSKIYGKIDYNTFILIKDQLFINTDDVLKFLYGIVDFDTYESIHKEMDRI